jgi:hypothetical protein
MLSPQLLPRITSVRGRSGMDKHASHLITSPLTVKWNTAAWQGYFPYSIGQAGMPCAGRNATAFESGATHWAPECSRSVYSVIASARCITAISGGCG